MHFELAKAHQFESSVQMLHILRRAPRRTRGQLILTLHDIRVHTDDRTFRYRLRPYNTPSSKTARTGWILSEEMISAPTITRSSSCMYPGPIFQAH